MPPTLESLAALPPALLYPILLAVAAIENVVPPFPADVIIAFGAFVAAQGQHRMLAVFLCAWLGNVAGALLVYRMSRRYGADRLERQLAGDRAGEREARFRAMLARYGLPALFLARFVPGVRALVPVVAGSLRLPAGATSVMLAGAAAIWYGGITVVAFRFGADWALLRAGLAEYARTLGVASLALLAFALVVWALARRRRARA